MNRASSRFARSWDVLEIEDVLLALWFLVLQRVVVDYLGASPATWVEPGENSLPIMLWVTLLALAVVLFTRGSRDTSIDKAVMRRILMTLPLYWVLSLIGMAVSWIRGGERSARFLGGAEAEWPFPAMPDWLRRLAATPILLIGDSAFLAAFEGQEHAFLSLGSNPASADYVGTAFLVALSYLLFVMGPRVAAGATGEWRIWLPRFAFYALALFASYRI